MKENTALNSGGLTQAGDALTREQAESLIKKGTAPGGPFFFAYRLPGSSQIFGGASWECLKGVADGFVTSPFEPGLRPETIPNALSIEECCNLENRIIRERYRFPFPTSSTSQRQHREEVEAIRRAIANGHNKKAIAARVKVKTGNVDCARTFLQLSQAYPNAFVFVYKSRGSGIWMGASPELLFKGTSTHLETMALAGSRQAGICANQPWDVKNCEEHAMVVEYILDCLSALGEVTVGKTVTVNAGPVDHMKTPLSVSTSSLFPGFSIDESNLKLESFLGELSPTPALCGFPKLWALDLIRKNETIPRGYYGGWAGPRRGDGTFDFYVNLRSMQVETDRYALWAGGGITHLSDHADEWLETERKLSTLQSQIILK